MDTKSPGESGGGAPNKTVAITLFGVGDAGINLLEQVKDRGLPGARFVAVNPDARALAGSSAAEKLHLETKALRGLGTGGDPERGRQAAEEHMAALKTLCAGQEVVLILAGLGGGSGTGISPVLAQAAKEAGALVLGFVTTPFDCEGKRRQSLAQAGLEDLKAAADGVICLPNQKVCKLIDENTSVLDTFKITNELLADGVRGIWRLLAHRGLIEIHLADLSAVMRNRHAEGAFSVAEATGPTRSRDVMESLLAHPFLDGGQVLTESDAVLVSLLGGPDLTMSEVNRVMEQVHRHCEHAQVIMGAAIDENFRERLAVTLIATRKNDQTQEETPKPRAEPAPAGEDLDTQLLNRSETPRPGSRYVPPPPSMAPEKMKQMLARQGRPAAGRGKNSSKLRQTHLPLEIVSKGRFDKSEPTIHRGEDLDVPTYIRRGIALN